MSGLYSASSASSWVSKFSTTSKVLPKDACIQSGEKVLERSSPRSPRSPLFLHCIPDIFPAFPGLAWPPVVFALDQSLPARSSPCGAARVGKPTAEKNWRMNIGETAMKSCASRCGCYMTFRAKSQKVWTLGGRLADDKEKTHGF